MNKKILIGSIIAVAMVVLSSFSIVGVRDTKNNRGNGDIIIVDNEGDGDFTSIKEAVNYSSPGDTIEVYSGIYREEGIRIEKDNITLIGIEHELGEGDDTGKPFIKPDGNATVIVVNASHVIISNVRIEKLASGFCIHLGADNPNLDQNNNTVSDCLIRNPYGYGIKVYRIGRNINIINNQVTNCNTVGIDVFSSYVTVKGNVITNCGHVGIAILGGMENISYNTIKRCRTGIRIRGSHTIIYGNKFEACTTGILNNNGNNNIIQGNNIELCPIGYSNEYGGGNRIIKNNFKECWNFLPWFKVSFLDFLKKDRWIENYWDTWKGFGPKRIFGIVIIGIPLGEWGIPIPILRFAFDWHPAQEPYDIGV